MTACKTMDRDHAHLAHYERKMTFGKYNGRYVREVPVEYFEWLAAQADFSLPMQDWARKCINSIKYYKANHAKRELAFKEIVLTPAVRLPTPREQEVQKRLQAQANKRAKKKSKNVMKAANLQKQRIHFDPIKQFTSTMARERVIAK